MHTIKGKLLLFNIIMANDYFKTTHRQIVFLATLGGT